MRFTVRYWVGDEAAGQTAYVSEGIEAESLDEVERKLQAKMQPPFFGVDSDAHGRVLISHQAVRFCSFFPAPSAEEAEAQARLLAAAKPSPDIRQRLTEAAEQVDADVRRF